MRASAGVGIAVGGGGEGGGVGGRALVGYMRLERVEGGCKSKWPKAVVDWADLAAAGMTNGSAIRLEGLTGDRSKEE